MGRLLAALLVFGPVVYMALSRWQLAVVWLFFLMLLAIEGGNW